MFFCGLTIEIFLHYILRIRTNIETTNYEPLWFVIHILLAIIAAYLLIKGTVEVTPLFKRLLSILIQLSFGYILYLAILLWYVIGTGLDSL